ncbi:L-threonine 3-dehydrogenase [Gimesia chilikensis]|jgi:threonine 3-dehydrogenase|uniref:L-threonine 3-dehydrogenase n=2 Tax=Gimesia TaxID=1649453 RepID=A0A517PV45_9PLAN|nr:L-threonine 3-dehydrogenase [Gimesia chilikensis]
MDFRFLLYWIIRHYKGFSQLILQNISARRGEIMKALVKKESKPGLWLEEVPKPTIGINDVLIKVDRTGICGTDVHIYKWDDWAQKTIPVPMVVGHEFVGEIVEVGSNVADYVPGEIVSGEGHVVCGRCRNCFAGRRHLCAHTRGVGVNRPGAFAEYISLPMTNIWHHDDSIDRDVASIFDPFGNAVHTALSFDVLGEDVLITGAGPIGVMAAAVVKHAGARHVVVTDVNPYRLELAKKMGATLALDVRDNTIANAQKELGMTEGFDVGLEMSGNPVAFRDMLNNMCHGGKIAMLGIPEKEIAIDWNIVVFNMLTLKGIYGREMYETWYKMTVMLQSGLDISPIITHRFHASEFEKGFEVMMSGQSGKVILDWNEM